jgi:hypothetical protein
MRVIVAGVMLLSLTARGQWLHYPSAGIPRTPDGKPNLSAPAPKKDGNPDLSGIWRIARPPSIPAGTGSYASLQYWTKEGVDISFQPWAEALYKQRYASFGAGRPSERCLPHGIPDAMHTIKRFRRRDFGHMEMQLTIDDPKAYTKPWSVTLQFVLLQDTELIEDVCDNERDAAHLIGK